MFAPEDFHSRASRRSHRDRSDRWRELSLADRRGQGRASHQNFGYRAGGRTSEVTVTHSEPREEPVTRPSLREYAAVQRERYLAATGAEKGTLLNEVVTVTGLHRKAAIRLLRRPPRAPTARSRAGRPPVYGSAVAQALEVLWQATGGIGPQRLHPFVPELLDRLARDGELRRAPEVAQLVRQVSPATLGRLIAPARATRPRRGAGAKAREQAPRRGPRPARLRSGPDPLPAPERLRHPLARDSRGSRGALSTPLAPYGCGDEGRGRPGPREPTAPVTLNYELVRTGG